MRVNNLFAVLDTSAMVAYLKGENGGHIIERIANNSIMSSFNITETIITLSRNNPEELEHHQIVMSNLVKIYHSDLKITLLASELSVYYKIDHNLSIGDCFCLALGKILNLPIYTADKLWNGLDEKIGIELQFIR